MIKDKFNSAAGSFPVASDGLPSHSQIQVFNDPDTVGEGRTALNFDVSKYLPYLEDSELTEAQGKELLESLWVIVVGFVDLGFGTSPIQQAMDKSKVIEGTATAAMVVSVPGQSETAKQTDEARSSRAPREWRTHEPY
ncbi:MAG: hypothetical protein BGO82_11035 [Devosia sp. 67-54]|uniref:hypothetical protein n=1 Tax=unclassified Devosia TaxID=196773 RepID=UPI0009638C81|nr:MULTISPECIES: hypothetical protein [unclassified Devosia]MBN9304829.1 hypothetical protein [Devosia sp.]OJX15215.1 MAG: hypothetical protein BGO82_11035 [Devosia sp. 67-54]